MTQGAIWNLFDFFGEKLGMALNEENLSKRARGFGL
jgi:hypothetical protein